MRSAAIGVEFTSFVTDFVVGSLNVIYLSIIDSSERKELGGFSI